MTANYRITFETPTHFGEADVEVDYKHDPDAVSEIDDGYYPSGRFHYDNVVLTDKATRKSEHHGEEMPDDVLNIAKDAAEEQFEIV